MSTVRRIAKNTISIAIGQMGWILLSLLLYYSSRILGVEDFGKYAFAFSFVNLFIVFSEFGLSGVVVRQLSRNRETVKKYLGNIIVIKLLLSALAFALVFISINLLSYPDDTKIAVYFLGAYMALAAFANLATYIFRAFEKMEFEGFLIAFPKFMTVVFGIPALLLGYGLIGLATAFLAAGILDVIVSLYLVARHFSEIKPEVDISFWKDITSQSIPFGLIFLFNTLSGRINTLMLSLFSNDYAVGIYSAADKFVEGFYIIPSLVVAPLYPVMSRYYLSSKESLQKTYYMAFKALFIFSLPLAVGSIFVSGKPIG